MDEKVVEAITLSEIGFGSKNCVKNESQNSEHINLHHIISLFHGTSFKSVDF
jgi:hypothetical protein